MNTSVHLIDNLDHIQYSFQRATQTIEELLSTPPSASAPRVRRRMEPSTANIVLNAQLSDIRWTRPQADFADFFRAHDEARPALAMGSWRQAESARDTAGRLVDEQSRREEPDYVPTTRDQLLARTVAVFQNVRALHDRIAIEVDQRRLLHQSVPSGLELWLRWNHMVADIQHDHLCYYMDNFNDFWFDGDVCEPDIDLTEFVELDYSPADGEVDYACFLHPKTGEQLSEWFSVAQVENQMRRAQSRRDRARGRQGLRAHNIGFDFHLAVAAELEALPGRLIGMNDVPFYEELGVEVNDDGNDDEQGDEDTGDNEHQDAEGEFEESEDDDVESSSSVSSGIAESLNSGEMIEDGQ